MAEVKAVEPEYCSIEECAEHMPCPRHTRTALKFGWSQKPPKKGAPPPALGWQHHQDAEPINVFREKGRQFGEEEFELGARQGGDALTPEQRSVRVGELRDQGNAFAEQGHYVQALRVWKTALIMCEDPDLSGVLFEQVAQVLMEIDQFFSAIQAAEEALKFRPHWAVAYLTLSRAQLQWGDPEFALKTLERGLLVDPANDEIKDTIDQVRHIIVVRAERMQELEMKKAQETREDITVIHAREELQRQALSGGLRPAPARRMEKPQPIEEEEDSD